MMKMMKMIRLMNLMKQFEGGDSVKMDAPSAPSKTIRKKTRKL